MDLASNVYRRNVRLGATPNPVMTGSLPADALFANAADDALPLAARVVRELIPSHQSAVALVVAGDWSTVRKFFSLSEKYAEWADYAVPARGVGVHNWLLSQPGVVRLTQSELVTHEAFRGFDGQSAHPPMRGWLAMAIRDDAGTPWGLVQLSDRIEGDYTKADAELLTDFTALLSTTLGALWDLRQARVEVAPGS